MQTTHELISLTATQSDRYTRTGGEVTVFQNGRQVQKINNNNSMFMQYTVDV